MQSIQLDFYIPTEIVKSQYNENWGELLITYNFFAWNNVLTSNPV